MVPHHEGDCIFSDKDCDRDKSVLFVLLEKTQQEVVQLTAEKATLGTLVEDLSSTVTVLKNPVGGGSAAIGGGWRARNKCGLLRYAAVPA
jgi:hypothetical protein